VKVTMPGRSTRRAAGSLDSAITHAVIAIAITLTGRFT